MKKDGEMFKEESETSKQEGPFSNLIILCGIGVVVTLTMASLTTTALVIKDHEKDFDKHVEQLKQNLNLEISDEAGNNFYVNSIEFKEYESGYSIKAVLKQEANGKIIDKDVVYTISKDEYEKLLVLKKNFEEAQDTSALTTSKNNKKIAAAEEYYKELTKAINEADTAYVLDLPKIEDMTL